METAVKLMDKPEKIMLAPEINRLPQFLSSEDSDDFVEDIERRPETEIRKKKYSLRYKWFACRTQGHLRHDCRKNGDNEVNCKYGTPRTFHL